MADEESGLQQQAIGALLASGFPFQTAVSQIVRQATDWDVSAEEFPWRDESGTDHFLDLVGAKYFFVVTIECKKTQKEVLTFLQPGGVNGDVIRKRCLYLTQIQDSTRRMELFCSDWRLSPKSAESAFCVVSTSASGKDQRLLERDAQLLVRATDAYAKRYKVDFKVTHNPEHDRVIVPIIVTNARLLVAEYDAGAVSLETGQLPISSASNLVEVPWVRFRKALTTSARDVGDRTVFIVRATELVAWLKGLEFAGKPVPESEGRVHIR